MLTAQVGVKFSLPHLTFTNILRILKIILKIISSVKLCKIFLCILRVHDKIPRKKERRAVKF